MGTDLIMIALVHYVIGLSSFLTFAFCTNTAVTPFFHVADGLDFD